jgi:phytanoyl-CoA hydroxylase
MSESSTIELRGSVDRIDQSTIEGWITLMNAPEHKISLDVVLNEQTIGQCIADRYRLDLDEAGIAGGRCAFRFEMPAFVPASSLNQISLRITGSPAILDLPTTRQNNEQVESSRPTVSQFGGLWTDRSDFVDRLAHKHRNGVISDEISDQISHFVRDGYVVLKGAVSADIIARINANIDDVWANPPEGLKIETFEPDGQMRYISPDVRWRNGATKLLDLYAVSEAAREAIASPMVRAFLSAIFEDAPKAFQGLTFWNGSQQAIHKDTAYVKIDSNPMHLAATWLALEDIQPGTGELQYYVGSHRAPDFLFGGSSKWMEAHTDDHPKFLESLHTDAAVFDQVKKSFLGKAGDVLIWHADLAHGGAPIENVGQTRRSLVTHFCPASDEPFYRRNSKYEGTEMGGIQFISNYNDIF